MPAAHFLGLRPRLVFAQYPDDLLLAEATPFHRPSPFSGDGLYLISAEFSGCRSVFVATEEEPPSQAPAVDPEILGTVRLALPKASAETPFSPRLRSLRVVMVEVANHATGQVQNDRGF